MYKTPVGGICYNAYERKMRMLSSVWCAHSAKQGVPGGYVKA